MSNVPQSPKNPDQRQPGNDTDETAAHASSLESADATNPAGGDVPAPDVVWTDDDHDPGAHEAPVPPDAPPVAASEHAARARSGFEDGEGEHVADDDTGDERDERAPLEPEESPESLAEPTAEETPESQPVTVARPVASAVPAEHHPVTDVYDEAPTTEQTWAPEPEPAHDEPAHDEPAHDEPARAEAARDQAAGGAMADTASSQTTQVHPATDETAPTAERRDEPTVGAVATPVFVTAPTKPRPKGNRGVGILIVLLATLVYAIVYALVSFGLFALTRSVGETISTLESYLTSWAFWIPVIFFFLAFVLLVAIANRAGWWVYVLGSFLIGVIVYFAYIGGALLQVEAWTLTPDRAAEFVGRLWTNPLTFAAAVVAREVPVWFGAWIAARGRRVRQRNAEAQEAYERELAAGPHTVAST
jgi:hypothetical protein